ncbi:MAG TPA: site-specific integrase [Deinococcales bacterium]|nr:site-specific integrase [Deinococcales bacterium]
MSRRPAKPVPAEPKPPGRKPYRRENRSGGITKVTDANGTVVAYRASATLQAGTPLERRVWHRAKTQKDAEKWLRDLLNLDASGLAPVADRATVASFTATWLDLKARQVRPVTVADYRKVLEALVLPRVARKPLAALTVASIEALVTAWHQAGVTVYQQRKGLKVLRMMLNDAMRLQVIPPRNPAAAVKLPARQAEARKAWTGEQAARFLAVHQAHELVPYVHVALTTGLRRSELLGLRWQDVNLSEGTLEVRQAITYLGGRPVVGEPKTANARRLVALDSGTVAMLERQREWVATARLFASARWRDQDLVFPSRVGTPASESHLSAVFRGLCAEAGVPNVTLYGLRHTYASLSLEAGVPVKLFSERMGHADVAFTMRQYVHTSIEQRRAAALDIAQLTRSSETNVPDLCQPVGAPAEPN